VHAPPRITGAMFGLLLFAGALRVAGPALYPPAYASWILCAQLAWIAAFAVFAGGWLPMLSRPRVDGQPG
jgi:uncharacterized protein involved in response to NO